ncbi:MAG TPA: aldehyde dehydrogenase family protein, partial [Candidatus Eisenbacteria bacterium]|nr:aldehyde dehydrogenase family protein [Candidatus Eisenbacteria bacterium]
EGIGEVQEMIDICDFAVGLSRQLYGLTIASERPGHRMMEQWHPLGPVLVVSAFNFPAAVWAWNLALAVVCGDPVIWKPSDLAPLTALECQRLFEEACRRFGPVPDGLSQLVLGGRDAVVPLVRAREVRLVSATGGSALGYAVKKAVADDLGKRCLLELGGNNAMIVCPTADLDLALRAILFSAVGTAGQRCTSLRRLFVHADVWERLMPRLIESYCTVPVGDPLDPATLVGPLRTAQAAEAFEAAIARAIADGGTLLVGGGREMPHLAEARYVRPAIVQMPGHTDAMREETFAPLLYAMRYSSFEEALSLQNGVPQGLSSCVFTNDVREAERFTTASGSDCGIANVNIGPSGAEIGGAFGGEKDTGGGRESGSDAWRAYMRRATNTVNWSRELPLAQGITFT